VEVERTALPPKAAHGVVRIVVVSDTHSRHRDLGVLPAGDLFVHCGDVLMSGRLLLLCYYSYLYKIMIL
jgi:hypothetical protein